MYESDHAVGSAAAIVGEVRWLGDAKTVEIDALDGG
jgi:hypothetical protein